MILRASLPRPGRVLEGQDDPPAREPPRQPPGRRHHLVEAGLSERMRGRQCERPAGDHLAAAVQATVPPLQKM